MLPQESPRQQKSNWQVYRFSSSIWGLGNKLGWREDNGNRTNQESNSSLDTACLLQVEAIFDELLNHHQMMKEMFLFIYKMNVANICTIKGGYTQVSRMWRAMGRERDLLLDERLLLNPGGVHERPVQVLSRQTCIKKLKVKITGVRLLILLVFGGLDGGSE